MTLNLPHDVIDEIQKRMDKLEAALREHWDSSVRRSEERHNEVVRRLSNVEAQTTRTNGTVSELQIKEAVRARLEQQAETFQVKFDRADEKRGDRARGWWMVVLAAGLAFVGMMVLTLLKLGGG